MKPIDQRARFETTHWSLVQNAGSDASSQARASLAILSERYWFPLYAFVRRRGYSVEDAQDLTQAFLARLLDKRDLRHADRERGRFRSFLLASLRHFMLNEVQHHRALKRGGGRPLLSLDLQTAEHRYLNEPLDTRITRSQLRPAVGARRPREGSPTPEA
jgi:RNA polymerase sigma-70 factor (ECF subfamily)